MDKRSGVEQGREADGLSTAAETPAGEECAGGVVRYRCESCGNLTRFDVVSERRTRAFYHFTLGGELTVEDEEVLSEEIIEISCRWCGNGGHCYTLGS